MSYHYAVLGAGMQGTAAAFDLLSFGEGASVRLLDRDEGVAVRAASRVRALVPGANVLGEGVDATDGPALTQALRGVQGVFSALPYALNPKAAAAAVQVGAHFCDLGGNTGIVREILRLDPVARSRGVSVVPDCGLAPGLCNVLGALAVARLRRPQHIHIRCGGLPVNPRLPLGYKLLFHIGGLTNEYTGEAEALRNGQLVRIPTLQEVETLELSPPLGRCEAFTTSGGTSTACETWVGRLQTYDYKTVRYPGHVQVIRGLRELGLLETDPVLVRGVPVVPRELFHACAEPRWHHPEERDLVILRVVGQGENADDRVNFELLDFHHETTGFTAMERTTSFPAAATLHLQVRGQVPVGAHTPERGVPAEELLASVRVRGLRVIESR